MMCKTCHRTEEECSDKKYGNRLFDGKKNVCGFYRNDKGRGWASISSDSESDCDEDEYHARYLKYFKDKVGQQTY